MTEEVVAHILDRFGSRWFKSLDIGEGWYPLVIQLDARLSEIDPDYTIAQVKEKFGGLRYYTENVTFKSDEDKERFRGLISEAEAASYKICERCGAPGESGGRGWVRTLCEQHRSSDD